MNHKEVIDLFEYIEKNTDIAKYEINDLKFWTIIRIFVNYHLLKILSQK